MLDGLCLEEEGETAATEGRRVSDTEMFVIGEADSELVPLDELPLPLKLAQVLVGKASSQLHRIQIIQILLLHQALLHPSHPPPPRYVRSSFSQSQLLALNLPAVFLPPKQD